MLQPLRSRFFGSMAIPDTQSECEPKQLAARNEKVCSGIWGDPGCPGEVWPHGSTRHEQHSCQPPFSVGRHTRFQMDKHTCDNRNWRMLLRWI